MKTHLLSASILLLGSVSVNAQWYQQTSGTVAAFSSIHCIDANTCYAAGSTTNVRNTNNGGTAWNAQAGSVGITAKTFVKMFSKDTVILGQTNGTLKRVTTASTGGTFSADIVVTGGSNGMGLNDIAFIPGSNTNFTAVGGHNSLFAAGGSLTVNSTNMGASALTAVGNGSGQATFFGIHAFDPNTFSVCGGGGLMYRTTNAGVNWTSIPTLEPATTNMYDVYFPKGTGAVDTGYAVGGNASTPTTGGCVYKSLDGGQTWVKLATFTSPNALFGVHAVSPDTCYVVGDGGKIFVTTDGGVIWTQQTSPVSTTLNKIYFPTSKVGYICGVSGVILKTTTGGFTAALIANAGPDASICPGSCATLAGNPAASGGTAPYTYSWNTGATTSSIVACPSATASYTLTVTDALAVTATDVATVTVYTVPFVDFVGLQSVYCSNAAGDTLLSAPVGGSYSGTSVGANDSIFNPSTAGPGTYTVVYTYTTNPGGCMTSASHTTTVLSPAPAAPLCMVSVDSTSAKHNTVNWVIWEKPTTGNIDSFRIFRSSPLAPSYTAIATVPFSSNGYYEDSGVQVDPNSREHSYQITTIDTCGNESAPSTAHTTIWLKVPAFSLPAKFILDWTDYAGFAVSSYQIQRSTDQGATWTNPPLNSVIFPVHTYSDGPNPAPSTSSRYRIRVKHPSGGCNPGGPATYNYTYSNWTANYTGVQEIDLSSYFSIFPNPNHGTFNLAMAELEYEVKSVKVCNLLGEVVYEHVGKDLPKQISIPNAAPGVYTLQVITDGGTANKKITVQ